MNNTVITVQIRAIYAGGNAGIAGFPLFNSNRQNTRLRLHRDHEHGGNADSFFGNGHHTARRQAAVDPRFIAADVFVRRRVGNDHHRARCWF